MSSQQLYPGLFYHIYNHGNADDNIFMSDDNYIYFLKRYSFFISPLADTLAYCLMPNHFHFVVQIKDENDIKNLIVKRGNEVTQFNNEQVSSFISKQFSNMFNSYTKSFNKMYKRRGKLFRLPFRRKPLNNDDYLRKAIHYVHSNPVHHSFVNDMHDWVFSSIHAYETNKKTQVNIPKAIRFFDNINGFKKYHQQPIDIKYKIDMDF